MTRCKGCNIITSGWELCSLCDEDTILRTIVRKDQEEALLRALTGRPHESGSRAYHFSAHVSREVHAGRQEDCERCGVKP